MVITLTSTIVAGASKPVLDVPGFDFSRLSIRAQKELLSILTDEFDYCGRPLSLLKSLQKGDACMHTKRLVGYAAAQVEKGASANEVLLKLAQYNHSFRKARATFKLDKRTCQGAQDAKVTILVFSDFECPYCAVAQRILAEFFRAKRSLRLCWAPFPLAQHPHALLAGQAALFARNHGKFWAMHDALFASQLSISSGAIMSLMKKLGLNTKAFEKAVAQNAYIDELNVSRTLGKAAGVKATPTIFINGRKFSLSLSKSTLSLAVDDELDWLSSSKNW